MNIKHILLDAQNITVSALETCTRGSTNQNPLPATGPGFALGPCHHSTAYCGQLQGSRFKVCVCVYMFIGSLAE